MLDARIQIRRTHVLMEIAEGTATIFRENRTLANQADELAGSFVEQFANSCAGLNFAIPKDKYYLSRQRARALLKEFNGRNCHDLALRYGVREGYIYELNAKRCSLFEDVPRAELLTLVVDWVVEVLVSSTNLDMATAKDLGNKVADLMATRFGGIRLVLPRDYRYRVAIRDTHLLEAFAGGNLDGQASVLGLSLDDADSILSSYRNIPSSANVSATSQSMPQGYQ